MSQHLAGYLIADRALFALNGVHKDSGCGAEGCITAERHAQFNLCACDEILFDLPNVRPWTLRQLHLPPGSHRLRIARADVRINAIARAARSVAAADSSAALVVVLIEARHVYRATPTDFDILKLSAFEAGMLSASPVLGLRPSRA